MNKFRGLHAAFLAKSFASTAVLISLIALSGHFAMAQAQSWKLKEIRVFNKIDGNFGTITSERYDASGGSVDLQINGDALSACPGGFEKLRFTWSFADNIKEVVSGGGVSASLAASQISKSQNCRTTLAARSFMSVGPSSAGSARNFSPEEYRLLDGDRFIAGKRFRAAAAEDVQSGTGGVKVSTYRFDPNLPWAYFEVNIGVPTQSGGGNLWYVYLYENTGGSSTGGGGNSGGFTIEYDTDRRGGDYKDFDLPQPNFELCRDVCANDSNCRAFTYVKPDGQGRSARCWLKSSVPDGAGGLSCCISGVKK